MNDIVLRMGRNVMRIGQVAPLFESVRPKHCRGTERVIVYVTEAPVRQGHEVIRLKCKQIKMLEVDA